MRLSEGKLQLELLDAEGRRMGEGRAEGMHLSDVLQYMRRCSGQDLSGGNIRFAMFGFIWEQIIEEGFESYVRRQRRETVRPEPMQVDGIWMSPDSIDSADETLEEFKATWKSLGRLTKHYGGVQAGLEEHFWYYLVQIMAYCKAWGTLKARLIVCFINGDYSFKEPLGGPQIVCLEMTFTQQELDDNWRSVLNHRDDMEAKMEVIS
jgi:hypothetical protein